MYNRLSELEFLEMASIGYKHTGIKEVILWVGPNAESEELRIKISNIPNCFDGKDCFSLTIPNHVLIGSVNAKVVTYETLIQIKKWCNKNMQAIKDYSEYKISTGDFIERLQHL